MEKVFHLSAGLGDIIYSLPAVKAMGGGIYICGDKYEQYLAIKPLLEAQSYITECKHISEIDLPRDFINLDKFRNSSLGNKAHLTNLFLDYFGFPAHDFNGPGWLENIREMYCPTPYVVVNITPRYRDKVFQNLGFWKREIKYLRKYGDILFLGFPEDYNTFSKNVGHTGLIKTPDLLYAAKVIKAAKAFSSNQSSLLAIRQGLGLPYRFEQSPNHVDCRTFSNNETIINPITRKLHLFITATKRLLDKKQ